MTMLACKKQGKCEGDGEATERKEMTLVQRNLLVIPKVAIMSLGGENVGSKCTQVKSPNSPPHSKLERNKRQRKEDPKPNGASSSCSMTRENPLSSESTTL